MSFEIITTTNPAVAAETIAQSISRELNLQKHVLFCMGGGSAIKVGLEVAKFLKDAKIKNLSITLTDERFGPVGFPDSNWQQLLAQGFSLPDSKLIPVLNGGSISETTEQWGRTLHQELESAEYVIGLFGVGADGHTAGILPGSEALVAPGFAVGYKTEKFERITLTPKAIEKFDEAVVWMQGEDKWRVIQDLETEIPLSDQPAQVLKRIPVVTMFTNYKK